MTRFFFAFLLALAHAVLTPASAQEIELAAGAPERHVVLPGDTLWDLSAKFLKHPWRWPEIWRMNRDQIRNPNRIYPGDIIVLERNSGGEPRLRLLSSKLLPQIYAETIREGIPAIPTNVIRPFLSEPLIVEANALDSAPRIIANQQDRVFAGNDDLIYVVGTDPGKESWLIYRNGKPLFDPQSNDILGYQAYFLGTAKQREPGEPAVFQVITAKEEIGPGDRLIPALPPPLLAYVPHRPDFPLDGRVISVYGGVDAAGRGSIVAINRGTNDGIEIGHVLALERNRMVVAREENDIKETVVIPSLRVGLLFIFRTFQRISYGLIVQAEGTIEVNDFARTP